MTQQAKFWSCKSSGINLSCSTKFYVKFYLHASLGCSVQPPIGPKEVHYVSVNSAINSVSYPACFQAMCTREYIIQVHRCTPRKLPETPVAWNNKLIAEFTIAPVRPASWSWYSGQLYVSLGERLICRAENLFCFNYALQSKIFNSFWLLH